MDLLTWSDGSKSLLEIAEKNWKLNPRDRMGLLLACCKDCIGAVSVEEIKTEPTI
jgi:serine/threonine-protein kinase HipA